MSNVLGFDGNLLKTKKLKSARSMNKMKTMDSVIPFKCDNPDCGKEYDQDLFAQAILLWGFIVLFSEDDEFALVGLTCTDCKKTTIQKYHASVAIRFIWELKSHLIKKHCFSNFLPFDEKWNGKYFSPAHLAEAGFIDIPHQETDREHDVAYHIPDEVAIEGYSETLQKSWPFFLRESEIHYFLSIENDQGYKALPRTLFKKPEGCPPLPPELSYPDIDSMLIDQNYETVNAHLQRLILPNLSLYDKIDEGFLEDESCIEFQGNKWIRKKLTEKEKKTLIGKNDLLLGEYSDFSIGPLAWKRKEFQLNFQEFIDKLKVIRNRINFELIFRNDLINKYGRKFYYKTKTTAEEREDQLAKQKGLQVDLDREKIIQRYGLAGITNEGSLVMTRSIPMNWITGPQLMERMVLNAFGIINLIQHYELIAYDVFCSVIIDKISLNPTLIEKLTTGDIEQQKIAMQRLCFHPDNIAAFEDYHSYHTSEPLALEKMEMELSPQPDTMPPAPVKKTLKEEVMECCQETAKRIVAENRDQRMTLKQILSNDEFKKCYEGKDAYTPTSDSGWRNWLKGIYSPKRGRIKGT